MQTSQWWGKLSQGWKGLLGERGIQERSTATNDKLLDRAF